VPLTQRHAGVSTAREPPAGRPPAPTCRRAASSHTSSLLGHFSQPSAMMARAVWRVCAYACVFLGAGGGGDGHRCEEPRTCGGCAAGRVREWQRPAAHAARRHARGAPTAARHSTAQHSTAQHSTAQHSTAQHSTAQHSTAQHSTAQHSTSHHSTAQHSTAQHSAVMPAPGPRRQHIACWVAPAACRPSPPGAPPRSSRARGAGWS
jgi:hypothetical protein